MGGVFERRLTLLHSERSKLHRALASEYRRVNYEVEFHQTVIYNETESICMRDLFKF